MSFSALEWNTSLFTAPGGNLWGGRVEEDIRGIEMPEGFQICVEVAGNTLSKFKRRTRTPIEKGKFAGGNERRGKAWSQ